MNKFDCALAEQLCRDYDCTLTELASEKNVFRPYRRVEGARPVGEASLLKMAAYHEKLLVMADARLLPWCEERFGNSRGVWLSEPQRLVEINAKLVEMGQRLTDTHHHYLPREDFVPVAQRFAERWYEQGEMETFREDDRFDEALLFDEETPDMLAVCAMAGETILGMAAATRNCEKLWEIGVNVTEAGRGQGVGTYVTARLREELLTRGIVPTYATAESHIKSQRVAMRAGFEPTFYELFSEK